jgi:glutaredoxin 3
MKDVVVWSKDNCSFCDQAKSLLNAKGIAFEEKKIGDGYSKEQLLEQVPSARSVPQILIDGTCIGGFNDLKHYLV